MMLATGVFALFGLTAVVGGVVGFRKAQSKASLVAGLLSGAALAGAAYLTTTATPLAGLGLGGATSLLLAGRFVPGFLRSRKLMPHGIMSGFSALGVLVALTGYLAH